MKLFDGHSLRDMWRGGNNAQAVLKSELQNGGAKWLGRDSHIIEQEPDLLKFLRSLSKRRVNETEAHSDKYADIAVKLNASLTELEDFEDDYMAIATAMHGKCTLITSKETAGGKKRVAIGKRAGCAVIGWNEQFKDD